MHGKMSRQNQSQCLSRSSEMLRMVEREAIHGVTSSRTESVMVKRRIRSCSGMIHLKYFDVVGRERFESQCSFQPPQSTPRCLNLTSMHLQPLFLMATSLRPIIGQTLAQTNRKPHKRLLQCATQRHRTYQTSIPQSKIPDFGFAFEYDMQPTEAEMLAY